MKNIKKILQIILIIILLINIINCKSIQKNNSNSNNIDNDSLIDEQKEDLIQLQQDINNEREDDYNDNRN